MNNIQVSVIMSTCNTEEEFLKSAIRSILNQTLKDIELIIVNDGGSNLSIIEQFCDDRIVIINHEETMGLPISLNEAIEKCKGKYIARMDSDDIAKIDRLEIQKKYLDKNLDIDICAMFYKKFYKDNGLVFNSFYNSNDVASQLFFRNVLAHPSIMFRREFLVKNNLRYSLEYRYSQDFEFWTRCTHKGKIALIPKLGLYYRIHGNQIRSSKKEMQKQLYDSVLIRNLIELGIDDTHLDFIKMLNGNYIGKINFIDLSDFIDFAIEKNKEVKRYNEKSFKKILYNAYFNVLLKNKGLKGLLNTKIMTKVIKFNNLFNIFKKAVFTIKMKLELKFDETLKILENEDK